MTDDDLRAENARLKEEVRTLSSAFHLDDDEEVHRRGGRNKRRLHKRRYGRSPCRELTTIERWQVAFCIWSVVVILLIAPVLAWLLNTPDALAWWILAMLPALGLAMTLGGSAHLAGDSTCDNRVVVSDV